MKYEVGDRVRIKSLDWYSENKDEYGQVKCGQWNFTKMYTPYCGEVMTIRFIWEDDECYKMVNSDHHWTDEMIECKVEEETKPEPKFKVGDKITNGTVTFTILTLASDRYFVEDNFGGYGTLYFKTRDDWKLVEEKTSIKLTGKAIKNDEMVVSIDEYALPEGYIFKDENGNVINATKIVLEKKKKEYPKTYEECCKVLGYDDRETYCVCHTGADERLFENLYRLKVCRDAYWKIAGEEMGLGKPWKPDWNNISDKYCIYFVSGYAWSKECQTRQCPFAFPTAEMRDAFKENFDPDIDTCKELL